MLSVEDLHAHYGRAHILQGVSLGLERGKCLLLAGRNGAGKSTTIRCIMGLHRPSRGRVVLNGADITGAEPHRIARMGIGYVPEDRRIFTDLTVAENLAVGRRDGFWNPARLFELFPALGRLRDRRGGRMSGGEQQMLAIARTLMGNPTLLLLDEPSEGLAPVVVAQLAAAMRALRDQGTTMLLAEQNPALARGIATRAAVLERGVVVAQGGLEVATALPIEIPSGLDR